MFTKYALIILKNSYIIRQNRALINVDFFYYYSYKTDSSLYLLVCRKKNAQTYVEHTSPGYYYSYIVIDHRFSVINRIILIFGG